MPTPLLLAALAGAAAAPPADAPSRLVAAALAGRSYDRAAELADGIGPRLSGSAGAAAAVEWALRRFREDDLDARLESVRVPHWVRGDERAEVIEAQGAVAPMRLAVTALGNGPGTPAAGVAGEVIEARSLEEVRALGERVRGRIVLFQHDMDAHLARYGDVVGLRGSGPAEAAKAGAVAALVRSLATASLRTPHTGYTRTDGAAIPAAAVATEDADLLHRLLGRGPVTVRLVLGCGLATPPEVESANVVAELRGRERPEEVVLVGAHLDSWDLGTGAADDAAGVAMVMETMRLLRALGGAPRRTVRAVLFMNEENGLAGARAYAERHGSELPRHVAAMEADAGGGRPTGYATNSGPAGEAMLRALAAPLMGLDVDRVAFGEGGADLSPLGVARVPTVAVAQDTSRYFDVHHSAADTLDKLSAADLARATAAFAAMAFALAESESTLPRPEVPRTPPPALRAR
jgi:hypothetical protein